MGDCAKGRSIQLFIFLSPIFLDLPVVHLCQFAAHAHPLPTCGGPNLVNAAVEGLPVMLVQYVASSESAARPGLRCA